MPGVQGTSHGGCAASKTERQTKNRRHNGNDTPHCNHRLGHKPRVNPYDTGTHTHWNKLRYLI